MLKTISYLDMNNFEDCRPPLGVQVILFFRNASKYIEVSNYIDNHPLMKGYIFKDKNGKELPPELPSRWIELRK